MAEGIPDSPGPEGSQLQGPLLTPEEMAAHPNLVDDRVKAEYMAHAENYDQTAASHFDQLATAESAAAARRLVAAANITPKDGSYHSRERAADRRLSEERYAASDEQSAAYHRDRAKDHREDAERASDRVAQDYDMVQQLTNKLDSVVTSDLRMQELSKENTQGRQDHLDRINRQAA